MEFLYYLINACFFLALAFFLVTQFMLTMRKWKQQTEQNVQFRYKFDNLDIKEEKREKQIEAMNKELNKVRTEVHGLYLKVSKLSDDLNRQNDD